MKIKSAVLIVLVVLAALLLAFGVYLLAGEIRHERLLKEYPVAYEDEIAAYSTEFDLDPYLVLAVMRCESSFDADAVSNRGAIGLMQVMPDTGTWIAHKLGLDDTYAESQLYDPATNVRFGCWYLQFLAGRFDGNVMHMVAAYNAGHGTVEKWLADPAYAENGKLTTIPYESTATYYARVMEALKQYRALYPSIFGAPAETEQVAVAGVPVLYSGQ